MRLRTWFSALAFALVGTTILAVATLLLSMRSLVDASSTILDELETVQNADGIALDLLRHRRQLLGWLDTHDASRLEEAASREHDVLRGIQKTRIATHAAERRGLDAVERDVRAYLTAANGIPTAPSPSASYRMTSPAFARAQESLEEFTAQAATRASTAKVHAQDLQHFLSAIGTGVAACVVGTAIVISIFLRRAVFRPVDALVRAIHEFKRTGKMPHNRLSIEFGEIERALHDMASTIERQRSNQLKFIASIAHDLRNPLTAMKGYCWMGRRSEPLPPEEKVRTAFQVIDRQLDRLNQQIGELLDRSRTEAGAFELHCAPANVADIVREVGTLFEGVAPGRIVVDAPPTLSVVADSTKLQQALTNLVCNAIKYSPDGGKVRVEARKERSDVVIEVKDQGIGINPDAFDQIFEPFRRSDQVLRKNIPGVGLGLSATRRIVEAHGGHVEVESEVGRGSIFRVYLPGVTADRIPPVRLNAVS